MLRFVRQLSTPRIRQIAVPVLALISLLVFLVSLGVLYVGDEPKPMALPPTTTTVLVETTTTVPVPTTVPRRGIAGFEAIKVAITAPDGQPKDYCALLADDNDKRAQGLMRQNDLGDYELMLFSFPQDTSNAFFMANVPVPLSVAWFAADGKFVSSADMTVCGNDASKCERYRAAAPYRYAVEVPQGKLGSVGITAGSSMQVGGNCV